MADVQVKLIKSLIGSTRVQIATAHALGLHKIGDISVQPDNPATHGKVNRITHLVKTCEAMQGGAN
ncbi:MAG: 50S ribosomal protein L30 [Clostridiales bacterium]|nr:50S ribosomal protein L30 [Clostridiales bacterium]